MHCRFPVALAILGLSGAAHAQLVSRSLQSPEPAVADAPQPEASHDRWSARPIAVLGQFGTGTPVGLIGLMAEWNVTPYFAVEAGLGEGGGADTAGGPQTQPRPDPLQLALVPRLRAPLGPVALSVGAGVSEGGYQTRGRLFADWSETDLWMWDHATWLDADVALEGRGASGFQWRVLAGVSSMTNAASPDRCEPHYGDMCTPWTKNSVSLFYLGAAFGYAIDI
jgi:hypothetical protein